MRKKKLQKKLKNHREHALSSSQFSYRSNAPAETRAAHVRAPEDIIVFKCVHLCVAQNFGALAQIYDAVSYAFPLFVSCPPFFMQNAFSDSDLRITVKAPH